MDCMFLTIRFFRKKSTYLLVHFNVQAVGHLVVLKVKRIAVNRQHTDLLTFQTQLLGQVSGQVILL